MLAAQGSSTSNAALKGFLESSEYEAMRECIDYTRYINRISIEPNSLRTNAGLRVGR
jgi:hypothetical protein